MLALLAVICFVLSFFHVTLGDYSFLVLGFVFLAAHFVVPVALPLGQRRV